MNEKTQTAERHLISRRLQQVDAGEFNRTVHELISFLDALHAKHPGYHDLYIDVEYGYEESTEFYLYGKRLETDKEMNDRIDKSERARIAYEKVKAKREAREKATLEKLKEKYGAAP